MVLMPGQEIVAKMQALLYASENIKSKQLKKGCCSRLCSCFPTIRSRSINESVNLCLRNDTSTIGYVGLQLMKGKIIILDNKIEATKNMVVKNRYVIAHTS